MIITGRDRRVVDSSGNEALVDSGTDSLQVKAVFDSTADLDSIETTLNALETLLSGTAKFKLWDGTDTLGVQSDGSLEARAMGVYSGSQVQIQVDANGKLVVTV